MMSAQQGVFVFVLIAQFVAQNLGTEDKEDCKFPDELRGSFFLGGSRDSFTIDTQNFGTAGLCYMVHDKLRYTIYKRPEKCFQCLQIWERHENVIQYKLGDCVKKEKHKKGHFKIP